MRLYCLSEWEESKLYTEMEKAALELTEHITLLPSLKVPDAVYHKVRKYFSETQYIHLTMLIMMINSWNRLSMAMGFHPEAE